MAKREEEQRTQLLQYGIAVLSGGGLALLLSVVFLFLVAFGISTGKIDTSLQYQLAVIADVFGGFLGGLLAVRRSVGKRLIVGLLVGAVLFLFQLTIGIVCYPEFALENGSMGLMCGALCGGAAAGILSGGKRKNPNRKKGKRKY